MTTREATPARTLQVRRWLLFAGAIIFAAYARTTLQYGRGWQSVDSALTSLLVHAAGFALFWMIGTAALTVWSRRFLGPEEPEPSSTAIGVYLAFFFVLLAVFALFGAYAPPPDDDYDN